MAGWRHPKIRRPYSMSKNFVASASASPPGLTTASPSPVLSQTTEIFDLEPIDSASIAISPNSRRISDKSKLVSMPAVDCSLRIRHITRSTASSLTKPDADETRLFSDGEGLTREEVCE